MLDDRCRTTEGNVMKAMLAMTLVGVLAGFVPGNVLAQTVCDPWGVCYTIPPRTPPEPRPSDTRTTGTNAPSSGGVSVRDSYDRIRADMIRVWGLAAAYESHNAKVDAYTHLLDLLRQMQALRDGPNVRSGISTIEALLLWSRGVVSDQNGNYWTSYVQLGDARRRRPDLFTQAHSDYMQQVFSRHSRAMPNQSRIVETNQSRIIDVDSASLFDAEPGPVDPEVWRRFQLRMLEGRRASDRLLGEIGAGIDRIKVPAPFTTRTVTEGVLLGMFNSQRDADAFMQQERSPWENKSYSEMHRTGSALALAFGTNGGAPEYLRGVMDHLSLGSYTLDLEHVRSLMPALQGTTFGRLVAHSNGATVAEALLLADVIRVGELHIVGGDRSLVNGKSLIRLLNSGKVNRVVVWINPGDPIPVGTGTSLSAHLEFARAVRHYIGRPTVYGSPVDLGMFNIDAEGRRWVEYCYLSGPGFQGQELGFPAHELRTYLHNIRLRPEGPRCDR